MGTGYTIAEIVVYPVKGCRGVSVPSAAISFTGFLFDREWMVVKAENGRAITMSRAPKLALVQPSLPTIAMRGESVPASATLEINAPGMKALNVPLRKCPSTGKARQGERGHIVDVGMPTLKGVYEGQGVDEGPEAAAWFTQYLDIPARLVRFDPSIAVTLFLHQIMCDFCKGFVMNVMRHAISSIRVISSLLLVDHLLYSPVLVCIES